MKEDTKMDWQYVNEDFRQAWEADGYEIWLSPEGYELYKSGKPATASEFVGRFDNLEEAQAAADTTNTPNPPQSAYESAMEALKSLKLALEKADEALAEAQRQTSLLVAYNQTQVVLNQPTNPESEPPTE